MKHINTNQKINLAGMMVGVISFPITIAIGHFTAESFIIGIAFNLPMFLVNMALFISNSGQ